MPRPNMFEIARTLVKKLAMLQESRLVFSVAIFSSSCRSDGQSAPLSSPDRKCLGTSLTSSSSVSKQHKIHERKDTLPEVVNSEQNKCNPPPISTFISSLRRELFV